MSARVAHLAIRWSDIQAMPPSPRRKELEHRWRRAVGRAGDSLLDAESEVEALHRGAEVERQIAVLLHDESEAVTAARLQVHRTDGRAAA